MSLVVIDENTVQLTATYQEGTTNGDFSPIQLSHTNVYVSVSGGAPVKGPDVPATAVTGGGAVSVNVAIAAANGAVTGGYAYSTETSVQGVESAHSNIAVFSIDRKPVVPPVPVAPTGFAIG
jgi:hypothetical protein